MIYLNNMSEELSDRYNFQKISFTLRKNLLLIAEILLEWLLCL